MAFYSLSTPGCNSSCDVERDARGSVSETRQGECFTKSQAKRRPLEMIFLQDNRTIHFLPAGLWGDWSHSLPNRRSDVDDVALVKFTDLLPRQFHTSSATFSR